VLRKKTQCANLDAVYRKCNIYHISKRAAGLQKIMGTPIFAACDKLKAAGIPALGPGIGLTITIGKPQAALSWPQDLEEEEKLARRTRCSRSNFAEARLRTGIKRLING
jgi:hypothetical protein